MKRIFGRFSFVLCLTLFLCLLWRLTDSADVPSIQSEQTYSKGSERSVSSVSKLELSPSIGKKDSETSSKLKKGDSCFQDLLTASNRVWNITDDVLKEYNNDIQAIIEKTSAGDTLSFQVTHVVQPARKMNITHSLIFTTDPTPTRPTTIFTCPTKGALLTVYTPSFTFIGFQIRDCTPADPLISVRSQGCMSGAPSSVNFRNVVFTNMTMKDNNRIFDASLSSCSEVVFKDVDFIDNSCMAVGCVVFPLVSTITGSTLTRNIDNNPRWVDTAVYKVPIGGEATFSDIVALHNDIRVIYVSKNATTTINGSVFEDNNDMGIINGFGASVKIEGSNFTNNTMFGRYGVNWITGLGDITVNKSLYSGNRGEHGACIMINNGSAGSIDGCTFSDNLAAGNGGVLQVTEDSKAVVSTSNFYRNSAQYGGGAYLDFNSTISIEKCKFENHIGYASGAAIAAYRGVTLRIVDSDISGKEELNTCVDEVWGGVGSQGGPGGALRLEKWVTAYIQSSVFTNNTAAGDGGAISMWIEINTTITDSTFEENAALNGAGMFVAGDSVLTINNTLFANNYCTDRGAAIFIASERSSVHVTSTNFTSNMGNICGAVRVQNTAFANFSDCYFYQNMATRDGGAISAHRESSVIVSKTEFIDNAASRGGALSVTNQSAMSISDCIVSNNTATKFGGAFKVDEKSSFEVSNTNFNFNKGKRGGCGRVEGESSAKASNCEFFAHSSTKEGGLMMVNGSNLVLIDSSVRNSSSGSSGGAIYLTSSTAVASNSSFEYSDGKVDGGAFFIGDESNAAISDSNFTDNKAGNGAGMFVALKSGTNIRNTLFINNSCTDQGAAIFLSSNHSFAQVTSTNFTSNVGNTFGAVCVQDTALANFSDCYFCQNVATRDGGAISAHLSGSVITTKTRFIDNAAANGGALSVTSQSSLKVSDCIVANNTGSELGGAFRVDDRSFFEVSNTKFIFNEGKQGGCGLVARNSNATSVGCEFLQHGSTKEGGTMMINSSSSLLLVDCNITRSIAGTEGGAFYVVASFAEAKDSNIESNRANNRGGGFSALGEALLRIENTSIISNSADHGGGVALINDSRLLCVSCSFEKNSAIQGGGLYVSSRSSQLLLAQLTMSTFRKNKASSYGGGMVVKSFGIRALDCMNIATPCDRIILDGTRFVHNTATSFGSSLMITKPDNVLVGCEERHAVTLGFMDKKMIRMLWKRHTLKAIDPKELCKSWEDGRRPNDTSTIVIGTFAQKFTLTTNSTHGIQIEGNNSFGFKLKNVKSGEPLPQITITTLDAFGNTHAPSILEGKALTLNSSEGSFRPIVRCSFKKGTCTIASLIAFVLRGNYTFHIYPRHDDLFEATTLTIMVRGCVINEQSTWNMRLCTKCTALSYNFDLSPAGRCVLCPNNANCATEFIKPEDGYWHKSPCHPSVKACIVEEACKVEDRLTKLDNLARGLDDCKMNDTMLAQYENAQCHEGYEGPLCGSCQESYGFSSSFECLKCGHVMMPILTLLVITCYLLIGTSITIKGVLPFTSYRHANEDDETPLLEENVVAMEATSSNQQEEVIEQNANITIIQTSQERASSPSVIEQQEDEIEIAKQKTIESWKILLNFFQVTSTVATMDVEWTDEVLTTLKKLQVLGAATINSVARPVDCLLSSSSRATRVIWRTLFSMFIPTLVIAILAMYWGYRAVVLHKGDKSYFMKRLFLTFITTTYITYFDLTLVAVRVFNCEVVYDNVDPFSRSFTRRWIADTSIECYKGSHIALICISLVVLTLVSIGFPLLCSLALLVKKDELHKSQTWAHDTLSFLCGPFKERYVYWECITMIKKAMLSIIIVFSYSLGKQTQGLLILMILGFFLYLHLICYPYTNRLNNLNYYEAGSLLTSCTAYTLVQFLNVETLSQTSREIVSFSLIVSSSVFVLIMVYKIASNIVRLLRIILVSNDVQVQDNISWLSTIKLYYRNRKKRHSST